jgi:GT2 family glycosyltransferase
MKDDDWFLVLNPDVFIDSNSLQQIVELSDKNSHQLTTVNLYKDSAYLSFDNCVRLFPSFFDFLFSFLGFKNKTIVDKSNSDSVNCVDWAAGSFLLFKSKLYNDLGGFDPNYFMYCEDIDICWRAQKLQEKFLFFYSEIKAIHYAQHANRSLLSIHFVWHIKSILRYILITNRLIKPYKDKL